ncbi:MAG: AAA family ATPase [Abitibacteriaceae bacterium]|nr:AAA family ATPase [Abditibacteriaceae bacterium]
MMVAKRIVVVGTSGSGKTTFAAALAETLRVSHIELDALHWEPNWVEVSQEVFEQRVTQAIAGDAWVSDGNYLSVRSLLWAQAEMIIWLDYALPVIMSRLLWRTGRRIVSGAECCNGNHEKLSMAFSRDSVILWALQTYRRHRRDYPKLFAQPQFGHLQVMRFQSPRRAEQWLRQVGA